MTNKELIKEMTDDAKRTEPDYFLAIKRLNDPRTVRLLHAAMGMATESGEFVDMLKRHIFYGSDIDRTNGIEEIGDQTWYQRIALDEFSTDLLETMAANVRKLRARFPGKFKESEAINRNAEAERFAVLMQPTPVLGSCAFGPEGNECGEIATLDSLVNELRCQRHRSGHWVAGPFCNYRDDARMIVCAEPGSFDAIANEYRCPKHYHLSRTEIKGV